MCSRLPFCNLLLSKYRFKAIEPLNVGMPFEEFDEQIEMNDRKLWL